MPALRDIEARQQTGTERVGHIDDGRAAGRAHEATGRCKFPPRINGRNLVALRQSNDLVDVVPKQWVNANLKCLDPVVY